MKQFILNSEPDKDTVRLEGNDYHYLVNVRRLAVGEFFPALLPNGKETLIQIVSINHGVLTGKCNQNNEGAEGNVPASLPPVILLQALPKGDKMDLIVRQAAEGGITEIVPFLTEFSVGKTGIGGQKFSRWERIIKEARQQSGSRVATALHKPLTLSELFDYWQKLREEGALGLLFHHQVLEQDCLHSYLNNSPDSVALAIGPEGGFSAKEVSLFMENGFKPLTIGDTILRTETAALYCSAAVRILLMEKNSWKLKQANPNGE
ncbi:MAG: 16S rRNA (uracil(1498)-N(3))-methyltransferase [Treponema sp.]|nr:16S rRNA (uracil(1498)-N(3))-methyltransferase [Treponema sp.]